VQASVHEVRLVLVLVLHCSSSCSVVPQTASAGTDKRVPHNLAAVIELA
jgi:hypothetical protein